MIIIIGFLAFHESATDFGDHSLGVRSIMLELGSDGADVPTNVGNGSMRAPQQGSR